MRGGGMMKERRGGRVERCNMRKVEGWKRGGWNDGRERGGRMEERGGSMNERWVE